MIYNRYVIGFQDAEGEFLFIEKMEHYNRTYALTGDLFKAHVYNDRDCPVSEYELKQVRNVFTTARVYQIRLETAPLVEGASVITGNPTGKRYFIADNPILTDPDKTSGVENIPTGAEGTNGAK